MRVGSGIGPRTCAPVRFAVETISFVDVSRIRWSNALRRMRMFWPFISCASFWSEERVASGEQKPFATPYFAIRLLDDAGDDARTDSAAAFPDSETQLLFHRDRHDERDVERYVIARHHHLRAFRQRDDAGHVRRAEIELRTIVGEERRVAATLFLGEDVGLGLEFGVRLHRARLAENLAALDFLALRTA